MIELRLIYCIVYVQFYFVMLKIYVKKKNFWIFSFGLANQAYSIEENVFQIM